MTDQIKAEAEAVRLAYIQKESEGWDEEMKAYYLIFLESDAEIYSEAYIAAATKYSKEIEELKAWKESAIAVDFDRQKVGQLLNIPLGQSIHDKIIPGIEALIAEVERLKGLLMIEFKKAYRQERPYIHQYPNLTDDAWNQFKQQNNL